MFAWLASKVAGGLLKTVTGGLSEAYQSYNNAKTDAKRLEAQVKIEQLSAQRDIILGERGIQVNKWMKVIIVFPFAMFLNKVLIWDNMMGLGVTDQISDEIWNLYMVIIPAIFAVTAFEQLRRK